MHLNFTSSKWMVTVDIRPQQCVIQEWTVISSWGQQALLVNQYLHIVMADFAHSGLKITHCIVCHSPISVYPECSLDITWVIKLLCSKWFKLKLLCGERIIKLQQNCVCVWYTNMKLHDSEYISVLKMLNALRKIYYTKWRTKQQLFNVQFQINFPDWKICAVSMEL